MKEMTCRQLGGACDKVFQGNSFDEIAAQSKAHGQEMYQLKDKAHMAAMSQMQTLMSDPKAMQAWFQQKKDEFDGLRE